MENTTFNDLLVSLQDFRIILRACSTDGIVVTDCDVTDFRFDPETKHIEIVAIDSLDNERYFWREVTQVFFEDIYHKNRRFHLSIV